MAKSKLIKVTVVSDRGDVTYKAGRQSGVLTPGEHEVTPEVHAVLLDAGYLAEE